MNIRVHFTAEENAGGSNLHISIVTVTVYLDIKEHFAPPDLRPVIRI